MEKNRTTKKQLERIKLIDFFILDNYRFPTHLEMMKMFKLRSTATANDVRKIYFKMKHRCPVCNNKYKKL